MKWHRRLMAWFLVRFCGACHAEAVSWEIKLFDTSIREVRECGRHHCERDRDELGTCWCGHLRKESQDLNASRETPKTENRQ